MRRFHSSLLVFALLAALVVPAGARVPPPTPAKPVVETLHGLELVDPYRWLEGSDAPEIEGENTALDDEVAAWTEQQNQYTRGVLDTLSGRDKLSSRLEALLEVGRISSPEQRGGHYFYMERRGDQSQAVLKVREGHDGEPRVLVDPNALDPEGLTSIGWFTPSHDGALVAFSLFSGGDENTTLYLLRTADGQWLAEEIPGKVNGASWTPDGKGFVYRRLGDLENPYSGQVKYHRVGTHHRFDPVLFEQFKNGPLATTWGPFGTLDHSGRWLIMTYFTGTESNDLWVFDFQRWLDTGELHRKDLIVGKRAQSFGFIRGNTMFVQTTLNAPNGRILAIDLRQPAPRNWRQVVPQDPDAVIQGMAPSKDHIAVVYLEKAATRIELFDHKGESQGDLALPGIGTASLDTHPETSEAFLSFQSFHEPQSIHRLDLGNADHRKGQYPLWKRLEVPLADTPIAVRQLTYASKDGTEVTMFVVHREGLELNGKNPTILYGYGGFNIPVTPSFSSRIVPWVEHGGVYALANLRGGGEYGDDWHRAGMLEKKQNVFDDFIAAGEHLIEAGYTNPQQLGILGGSNGGLLTGATLVQRPDLFSAVVSSVPLLDMLRYQHFLMARYWVPEYGSAEDAHQMSYLLEYSPYQNVEKGVKYPAVLLTAGENDTRVHPLHARKMAARLQAATANDPSEEPVLLWVEGDVGHGAGKPLALRKRDTTDVLAFFAWQLGMSIH